MSEFNNVRFYANTLPRIMVYDYDAREYFPELMPPVWKRSCRRGECCAPFRLETAVMREGFSFVGWSFTPNGNVDIADGDDIIAFSDINLYAVWTPTEESA